MPSALADDHLQLYLCAYLRTEFKANRIIDQRDLYDEMTKK